ncbi:Ribonuclease 1 [Platanthera guangdongensis]|uniref:Ribonuclease 1 n=1 Tax=Platanthera guangdongensis TaxID=2320717 RepID=A0ABR2LHL5_9ASPA
MAVFADSHTPFQSPSRAYKYPVNPSVYPRNPKTMNAHHALSFSPFIFLLCIFSAALCSAKDFDFFYFVQQVPTVTRGGAAAIQQLENQKQISAFMDFGPTITPAPTPQTVTPIAPFNYHRFLLIFNFPLAFLLLIPPMPDAGAPNEYSRERCYFYFGIITSRIADLIDSMRKDWPTLACPSSDGNHFWGHEWEKHGTCCESELDQHAYFEFALSLKKKTNLLQALKNAGIEPDGGYYSTSEIKDAIRGATGFAPGIECSVDEAGNKQLNQVYMCVDATATNLIECPIFPRGRCSDQIEFPPF